MKKRIILFSYLFLVAFMPAIAQTGSLKGMVTDGKSGSGIKDVIITVNLEKSQLAQTKSAADGSFSIHALPAENLSVKFEHPLYKPLTKENVLIEANKSFTLNVILLKNKQQKPGLEEIVEVEYEEAQYDIAFYKEFSADKKVRNVLSQGYTTHDAIYIEHNTESYDLINENIFRDVISNPLSTFSVDVDRASYSNVRRFLKQNQMPYKDAVRIEEMINYFDYDYPQPKGNEPFLINLELSKCPWNDKHELLLVGLQGKEIKTANIPPANLVFLIDVSGSMNSSNKLPLLKQAFKILIENIRPADKVAMVVYAGSAGVVLESTQGSEKHKISAALDMLQAGGSTAGGAGIEMAYKIAKQNYIKDGNNRVILATDGDFNIGASSDAEMVRLIEEKRKDGIFLSILGFGMGNYKDSKMEQLSNAGNGNYAYIDNILEAKKVFGKEIWGTLYTIAKDVKFQIEFNPAQIKAYRLIGYENRMLNKEDFNDDKKDAGEIGSGHTVTALYEIISANSDEKISDIDPLEYQNIKIADSKNLLTVKLRYKEPGDDESKLIVNKYKKADVEKAKPSENFNFAASVAGFGMLLRDSEFKADANFDKVLSLAKESKGKDENGYRAEFISLVETAQLLNK